MKVKVPPVFAALALTFHGAAGVDLGDGLVHLKGETYSERTGPKAPADRLQRALSEKARETYVVTFRGPADQTVRDSIERVGRIVGYVPSHAYLVRALPQDARRLASDELFERVDWYRPGWKISSALSESPPPRAVSFDEDLYRVEVFRGEDPEQLSRQLRAMGIEVVVFDSSGGVGRVVVRSPRERLSEIADLSLVEWIEALGRPTLRNDQVRWVLQSNVPGNTPIYERGLLGEGQIIGHIDGEIHLESCFFADPDEPSAGPNHRKIVGYRSSGASSGSGHGTHTAGTAAGDPEPVTGSIAMRGMAPKARLSFANFNDLNGSHNDLPSNLNEFLENAHADGARIHTNSWGDDFDSTYTTWSRDADLFSRNHEDDLVLFAIANLSSLRSPENAKNVLAVGASRKAPFQDDHGRGGAGPTLDGRRKPEVFAPGVGIWSASTGPCDSLMLSGTSMACPCVAGGAALVREYLMRGFYPLGRANPDDVFTPSGALLKALVVNSAVDMTGIAGYPSDREGWGRVLLDNVLYFPGDSPKLWLADVRHARGLGTGGSDSYTIEITDSAEPLKVTMVFVDEPASVGAALAPVNDLDLELEGPGGLFRGNVFDPEIGRSVIGGSADQLNNVERIVVHSPTPGEWTVRVWGTDVPMGPQGYAVCANARMGNRVFDGASAPQSRNVAVSLGPAVPNPFSGETRLTYQIPSASRVRLHICDLQGRRVRVLVDREVQAGEYAENWDGRDEEGQTVSAGIYFARLVAAGRERSAKVAFLP